MLLLRVSFLTAIILLLNACASHAPRVVSGEFEQATENTNKGLDENATASSPADENTIALIETKKSSSYDRRQQASIRLYDQATTLYEQQEYDKAAAVLERGLRLSPKNAYLWQGLAQVRLAQLQYKQAEQCARKSNALARGNRDLKELNDEIIFASHKARLSATP